MVKRQYKVEGNSIKYHAHNCIEGLMVTHCVVNHYNAVKHRNISL